MFHHFQVRSRKTGNVHDLYPIGRTREDAENTIRNHNCKGINFVTDFEIVYIEPTRAEIDLETARRQDERWAEFAASATLKPIEKPKSSPFLAANRRECDYWTGAGNIMCRRCVECRRHFA